MDAGANKKGSCGRSPWSFKEGKGEKTNKRKERSKNKRKSKKELRKEIKEEIIPIEEHKYIEPEKKVFDKEERQISEKIIEDIKVEEEKKKASSKKSLQV